MGRKRSPRRIPSSEQRAAAAATAAAENAQRTELAKLSLEDRAELEALRQQVLAEEQERVQAAQQRYMALTIEWMLCAAYEPVDLEGRVRCIERAICPLCGACLPRVVEPIPPLLRGPGEGDPLDRATPHCPWRLSELRARQQEREVDTRAKRLMSGTPFGA